MEAAKELLGETNVISKGLPVMASEDFSYYMMDVPGCFFFLNNVKEGEQPYNLHSNYYQFNDRILSTGALMFTKIVEKRFKIKLLD